jgi:hypothetical protein
MMGRSHCMAKRIVWISPVLCQVALWKTDEILAEIAIVSGEIFRQDADK